ncbi:MAG: Unknown protein [uncultured Sulfurovum sp.]|uniref:Uncharacterized protein n=1 Tax=uncultured Sulfurovum sp. TaxID=269237 RepID=A0A6S6U439_9BACT|nr:MAG: Unknown protein [uncultured Sulfurovum sp.]
MHKIDKRIFSTKDILILAFRKRPAMFTGDMTLESIFLYFNTYRMALIENGFEDSDEYDSCAFHEFVKNKFGFYESTAGWKNMIVADILGLEGSMETWSWEEFFDKEKKMTSEEHKKSIELYFELFDVFMENK